MNKNDFLRALPEPLRTDPQAAALAQVVAQALDQCAQETEAALIYSNIENLPETLLDILAYDFKIDWYDSQYTLEEKRHTIRDSWRVRRFLGTKYAVETALSAIYSNVTVEEWFEYGGKPYHFRVHLNILDNEYDSVKHKRVKERIQWYKNLRSWLDSIWYDLPPIIIKEQPGNMLEKDLHFKTFVNYWGCYCFNGTRRFDGRIDFSSRRGGLSMVETHIRTSAKMPHRFYPTKLQVSPMPFVTKEKVLSVINCGRTVFYNMGDFVPLNMAIYVKLTRCTSKPSVKKLCCSSAYAFHNSNKTGNAYLAVIVSSRMDGKEFFNGALTFNGKAIPKTEII